MGYSSDFLSRVKDAELWHMDTLLRNCLGSSVQDYPQLNRFSELDRRVMDHNQLAEVVELDHKNAMVDAACLAPVYELQRAVRDINIGKMGRVERLVSGLSILNKRRYQLQKETK